MDFPSKGTEADFSKQKKRNGVNEVKELHVFDTQLRSMQEPVDGAPDAEVRGTQVSVSIPEYRAPFETRFHSQENNKVTGTTVAEITADKLCFESGKSKRSDAPPMWDFVVCIAERDLGISQITTEATADVAHEAELRLRLILQDATKFMAHSKRKCLKVRDIQSVIQMTNCDAIYGPLQGHGHGILYELLSEGGIKRQWDEEEKTISRDKNMFEFPEEGPTLPIDGTMLRAHWLAIDGVKPRISQNKFKVGLKGSIGGERMQQPAFLRQSMFAEMHTLLTYTQHALENRDEAYCKIVGECLSKECFTAEVTPHLTKLIFHAVTKKNSTARDIRCSLHLLDALLNNKTVRIVHYLHQVLPSLVTCLVKKSVGRDAREEHWDLRLKAARTMKRICSSWIGREYPNIELSYVEQLGKALTCGKDVCGTQHGALIGLFLLEGNFINEKTSQNISKILDIVICSWRSSGAVDRSKAARVYAIIIWILQKEGDERIEEKSLIKAMDVQELPSGARDMFRKHFPMHLVDAEKDFVELRNSMGQTFFSVAGFNAAL